MLFMRSDKASIVQYAVPGLKLKKEDKESMRSSLVNAVYFYEGAQFPSVKRDGKTEGRNDQHDHQLI